MGKSAKAAKRPSKKQNEFKKVAKAAQEGTGSKSQKQRQPIARTASGGVSKPKTTKTKVKLAASTKGS
ncbi:hypothetical protein LPJ81_003317, partial [Coemansia sp. IMI 209127]